MGVIFLRPVKSELKYLRLALFNVSRNVTSKITIHYSNILILAYTSNKYTWLS